jgi:hypothetical protein
MVRNDTRRLLLPEGTRLVHIGPPKTGTTAVQGAFHRARQATLSQGVRYAGSARHSSLPILAVLGKTSYWSHGKPPPLSLWQELIDEIERAAEPRVLLSSEFLAEAKPKAIQRIARDLDPSRVHVVVTLRPLALILGSQWQQYVQSGLRWTFDDWLDGIFGRSSTYVTPSFWLRHRHDQLIQRWADVVGPKNVTVVALDEGDRQMAVRVFEELLGLREGTLLLPSDFKNRSLTLPEAEVIRALNVAFRDEGLSGPLQNKIMKFGAAGYLKRREPAPDEQRIQTPQWALDQAVAIEREMVDCISSTGVRIVGDLNALTAAPDSRLVGERQPEVRIRPEVAASIALALLQASQRILPSGSGQEEDGEPQKADPMNPPLIEYVSTSDLISALPGRIQSIGMRYARAIPRHVLHRVRLATRR